MTLRQKISDIPLYLQILIGMITGIIIGLIALQVDGGDTFIRHWIQPWGQIFIRLLQLIAIPLVFISLIKGMTGLKDISKFSRIGGKTIGTYICTTVVAILIGLAMGLLVQPGKLVNHEQVAHLQEQFIRAMYPVQLFAFTTSSSAATLPVTLKTVEQKLGISEEVSSFVLPVGVTINMDGTEFLPTLYHRCYDRTFFYRYPGYPRRQLCHLGNGAHFRRHSGRRSGIDIGGGPTIGHAAHRSKCNRRCSGMFHY